MESTLFYGWYIVIAGAAINATIGGIVFYGFTAMVNPIAETFGWSYAQISLATTLRGIETGVLNPIVGVLVDRIPAYRLILFGVMVCGFGLFCLGLITSLSSFYICFLTAAVGVSFCVLLTPLTTVMHWFHENVGKATSMLALGIGLGGLTVPVITLILDAYGWRISLIILAVIVWVLGIPLAFIFKPNPPGRISIYRNEQIENQSSSELREYQDSGVELKEAAATRAFWHIGIAFMLQTAALAAPMLHIMPHLENLGINRTTASAVAMSIPLVSLPARFLFGWLSDVIPRKYTIAMAMTLTGVGLLLFSVLDQQSTALLIFFIIVYGFGLGGYTPLMPPIVKQYFGTKKFGTIFGVMGVFLTTGGISTPFLAGLVFDTVGSYGFTWIVLAFVALGGAVTILMIPSARVS